MVLSLKLVVHITGFRVGHILCSPPHCSLDVDLDLIFVHL